MIAVCQRPMTICQNGKLSSFSYKLAVWIYLPSGKFSYQKHTKIMASDTAAVIPIKRLLFNADATVTVDHVKQVYGERAITMTIEVLDELVAAAKVTKEDVLRG